MTRAENMARINEERRQATEAFIEDYWHFKGYGWDDRRIAQRLNVNNYESFRQRLRRNGITADA